MVAFGHERVLGQLLDRVGKRQAMIDGFLAGGGLLPNVGLWRERAEVEALKSCPTTPE